MLKNSNENLINSEENVSSSSSSSFNEANMLPTIPNSVLFNGVATPVSSARDKNSKQKKNEYVSFHYNDIEKLRRYLSEGGRILPARITGLSRREQDSLEKAVKKARQLMLLPYKSDTSY